MRIEIDKIDEKHSQVWVNVIAEDRSEYDSICKLHYDLDDFLPQDNKKYFVLDASLEEKNRILRLPIKLHDVSNAITVVTNIKELK